MRKILSHTLLFLVIALSLSDFAALTDDYSSDNSIVSKDRRISDYEARFELARVLAADPATRQESLRQYLLLLKAEPDSAGLHLAAGEVMLRTGNFKEGVSHLKKACLLLPKDVDIRSRAAALMMEFGAFYRAEALLRDFLKATGDVSDIEMNLAELLVASGRFPEAEKIYRKLYISEKHPASPLIIALARLRLREHRPETALQLAREALAGLPENLNALEIKAKAFRALEKDEKAAEIYLILTHEEGFAPVSMIELGLIAEEKGDRTEAEKWFARALDAADCGAEPFFFLTKQHTGPDLNLLKKKFTPEAVSPDDLIKWGDLYREHGFHDHAIRIYNMALDKDPHSFAARMGLAGALAQAGRYSEALGILSELDAVFPDNYQVLLETARISGWERDYERSFRVYYSMHELNPRDSVTLREKYRTAMWAGRPDVAKSCLRILMEPSVDSQLLNLIYSTRDFEGEKAHIERLTGNEELYHDCERPFALYETVKKNFNFHKKQLSAHLRSVIESLLIDLLPQYRMQKAVWLEHTAKDLVYEGKLRAALPRYRELLSHEPGNQEALFDYAQLNCRLGLCKAERSAYEKLLNISPAHGMAALALERRKMRSRPALNVSYSYWNEEGRDELSGITRKRWGLTLEAPVRCNHMLFLTKNYYHEAPHLRSGRSSGWGQKARLNSIYSQYFRSELGLGRKRYSRGSPTHRGFARAFVNLSDYVELGAGYERRSEYSNFFALHRDIQSNRWWVSASTDLTRRLGLEGKTRYIQYTDSNSGRHHSASVSYRFSDFPRMFKATLHGDMRHTRNTNEYIFTENRLDDIIYPYWTPRHYRSAALTLNWRHDISEFLFCGSPDHNYDVKVTGGLPSDNNNYVQIEAAWHYDFARHFKVELTGLIHRSREWDSEGLYVSLNRRF